MDRRKFVRGAGVITGLLGGVLAGKEVVERIHTREVIREVSKPVEDISHLKPPQTRQIITLRGDYSNEEKKPVDGFNGLFDMSLSPPKTTHKVDMTVGLDNRLWIGVNGEWKRVVVEG